MNIKKILIPTELNDLSSRTTEFAVDLADQAGISEVILLNIIVPAHSQTFAASGDVFSAQSATASRLNLLMMEKHQKRVEKLATRYSTDSVTVKPYVRFNDSKTNLNEYMQHFDAGLLVCGSHDRESFLDKLFVTKTEKIIRKVDYPVIILKKETEFSKIKNIALAIDLKEEVQHGLDEVVDFAAMVNAKLQLLHVIVDNEITSDYAIEKLQELSQKNNLKNFEINVVNSGNLESGLYKFSRKYKPDMIAVLSEGKGKIRKLIFGSSTDEIVEETDKPVFVSKID
jgi:nucleotide-binding universal stress UspA family protein